MRDRGGVLPSKGMSIAGVPLWSLVLVACIVAPLLVRAWVEAEQRRARERTARVLEGLVAAPSHDAAPGPARQATDPPAR